MVSLRARLPLPAGKGFASVDRTHRHDVVLRFLSFEGSRIEENSYFTWNASARCQVLRTLLELQCVIS